MSVLVGRSGSRAEGRGGSVTSRRSAKILGSPDEPSANDQRSTELVFLQPGGALMLTLPYAVRRYSRLELRSESGQAPSLSRLAM